MIVAVASGKGGTGKTTVTASLATVWDGPVVGVDLDVVTALNAWNRLDAWIDQEYRDILKRGKKNENHLTSTIALYGANVDS